MKSGEIPEDVNIQKGHFYEPEILFCPFCTGKRIKKNCIYIVFHFNEGTSKIFRFLDPCRAWSLFDALRASWTGIILAEQIFEEYT